MKKILAALCLTVGLLAPAHAAITFRGTNASHFDGGSNPGPTTSIDVVSSMVTGDLVLIIGQYRGASATLSISDTGGQSWTALSQWNGGNTTGRVWWARFNGTWSSTPSITVGTGTQPLTGQMIAFVPTSGANVWSVDTALSAASYTAPLSPFTVTRTGVTTTANSTVTLAIFQSEDDTTWENFTGTGWGESSQVRNTAGLQQSEALAFKIQTSSGATGNVSFTQDLATAGDAGFTAIVAFTEASPPTTTTSSTSTSTTSTTAASTTSTTTTTSTSTSAAPTTSTSSTTTTSTSTTSTTSTSSTTTTSTSSTTTTTLIKTDPQGCLVVGATDDSFSKTYVWPNPNRATAIHFWIDSGASTSTQLEVSMDGNAPWATVGSAVTTDTTVSIQNPAGVYRVSYTTSSGAVTVCYGMSLPR